MTTELIFIIILAVFVFVLIGVALHLAKTIEQQRRHIGELKRDLKKANELLKIPEKKGGVTGT